MLPVKVLTCLLFVFLFYSNMFLPSVITVVIRLCALFIRTCVYLFAFLCICLYFCTCVFFLNFSYKFFVHAFFASLKKVN